MRTKIIPHGFLLEHWPTDFEVDAETPIQALRTMEQQFKLRPPNGMRNWTVQIVGHDSESALNSPLRVSELHIVPAFVGGGGSFGGFFKIIIGAVLIVASYFIPVTWPALIGTMALSIGTTLVLGGLVELLSPAPKINSSVDNAGGSYLGNPLNTTKIGTRISIGYGRFPVYGQVISYFAQADPGTTPASVANSGLSGIAELLLNAISG